MKLFVGNLNFRVKTEDLQDLFSNYGQVTDAIVLSDRQTGRSRGFGFVTMGSKEQGEAAIEALNNTEFEGRNLHINEARPREDRPQR